MTRRLVALTATLTLLAAALAPASAEASPQSPSPRSPQRWIVRYASPQAARQGTVRMAGEGSASFTAVFPGQVVSLDAAAAGRLRGQRGVVSVEPDVVMHAAQVQRNPPAGLDRIDQRTARPSRTYTSIYTGAGVKIYLIDSGLNLSSTDFAGRVQQGPNFADGGGRPQDCEGHGTHVAGIAAGTRFGVAKRATIVPIKVLGCDGAGYASDTIRALDWVISHHRAGTPAVVNMSLTGPRAPDVDLAVNKAIASGITVVGAAGNRETGSLSSPNACSYSPSDVPGAITVANATGDDRQAPTTNYGRCVSIFAPGTRIVSDYIGSPTATATMTGSSMATPAVSGAAALVLQARPTWKPAQVKAEILGKATRNALRGVSAGTPNLLLYTIGGVTPGMLERVGTPVLSGTPRIGSVLRVAPGSWGNPPVTLGYSWYRRSTRGVTTAIAGARSSSYRITSADRGQRILAQVIGSSPDHRYQGVLTKTTSRIS